LGTSAVKRPAVGQKCLCSEMPIYAGRARSRGGYMVTYICQRNAYITNTYINNEMGLLQYYMHFLMYYAKSK